MITLLLMLCAFATLFGVALLYLHTLKLNIGEGFVLSTVTLVTIIYLTGLRLKDLQPGRYIFCGLAATGLIVTIVQIIRKRFDWSKMDSPYLPILFVLLILSVALYYRDFIRYSDEFHMWAAAVKYMLANNRLPLYDDFASVHAENVGTCTFHYFFQSFTGYQEGMMYASGSLLSWIGLLLPVSNTKLTDKDQCLNSFLYTGILFLAMPTIYFYGIKNIYVDVATAGMVGGLAGWCLYRQKKWQNGVLIAGVMWTAYLFKDNVGLALDIFFLLLFLVRKLIIEKKDRLDSKNKKIMIGSIAVIVLAILAVIAILFVLENYDLQTILPESINAKLLSTRYNYNKVYKTVRSLAIKAAAGILGGSAPKLKISFFAVILLSICIIYIYGYINDAFTESWVYNTYALVSSLAYIILTLCVYLLTMTDLFSERTRSGKRYLAIYAIFLMVFSLSLLFFHSMKWEKQKKWTRVVGMILILYFAYGIRVDSLHYYTDYANKSYQSFYELKEQKEQAALIQKEIGREKKVYFLNQKSDRYDEYAMNPAFYYMDKQINHIWHTPWQYTERGGIIHNTAYANAKIHYFSKRLTDEKYSYVWIYKTNDYLNKTLPTVMRVFGETTEASIGSNESGIIQNIDNNNPANIIDGQLYKIVYDEQGTATGLKLLKNLCTYDNRVEYADVNQ